jgi:hypothetical protein
VWLLLVLSVVVARNRGYLNGWILSRKRSENCEAGSGNSVPTFRDNLSVPSSSVKNRNLKLCKGRRCFARRRYCLYEL